MQELMKWHITSATPREIVESGQLAPDQWHITCWWSADKFETSYHKQSPDSIRWKVMSFHVNKEGIRGTVLGYAALQWWFLSPAIRWENWKIIIYNRKVMSLKLRIEKPWSKLNTFRHRLWLKINFPTPATWSLLNHTIYPWQASPKLCPHKGVAASPRTFTKNQ